MLDAESLDSPLEIQSRHDAAFDVEAVSKRASLKDYKSVFQRLQEDLTKSDQRPAVGARLRFAVPQPLHVPLLYSAERMAW